MLSAQYFHFFLNTAHSQIRAKKIRAALRFNREMVHRKGKSARPVPRRYYSTFFHKHGLYIRSVINISSHNKAWRQRPLLSRRPLLRAHVLITSLAPVHLSLWHHPSTVLSPKCVSARNFKEGELFFWTVFGTPSKRKNIN